MKLLEKKNFKDQLCEVMWLDAGARFDTSKEKMLELGLFKKHTYGKISHVDKRQTLIEHEFTEGFDSADHITIVPTCNIYDIKIIEKVT